MLEGLSRRHLEAAVTEPLAVTRGVDLDGEDHIARIGVREAHRTFVVEAYQIGVRRLTGLDLRLHPRASVSRRLAHVPQVVYDSGPYSRLAVLRENDMGVAGSLGVVDAREHHHAAVRGVVVDGERVRRHGTDLGKAVGILCRQLVEGAVAWFQEVKIEGLKRETFTNADGKKDYRMVPCQEEDDCSPLWARFYTLEDNRPFFCDRDGVKRYNLSEIGYERRNGYSWYNDDGEEVLEKYAEWKKKICK